MTARALGRRASFLLLALSILLAAAACGRDSGYDERLVERDLQTVFVPALGGARNPPELVRKAAFPTCYDGDPGLPWKVEVTYLWDGDVEVAADALDPHFTSRRALDDERAELSRPSPDWNVAIEPGPSGTRLTFTRTDVDLGRSPKSESWTVGSC